ncbi:restriction endonuclease subunit S [Micromonospora sp. NBC_00421]|uniref:restriction endonuclease subunit S n=1 Tax=Micromonospora sp. NBC_00421 TaxID=2975976 RepID=UPI002E227886
MTDLPPGWEWCTLGDLVTRIEAGKSFTCHPRPARDNEWGVLKVSAMTWGEFREQENKAVPEGREFDPRYEVRPGDILVSRANTEQYVGAPVLVRKCRPRLLLSDKSLRLVPSPEIDSAWLLRVLSSPSIRRQISARASGQQDSMRNISQQALLSLELPIPPLAEQRRIVAALEGYLSKVKGADALLASAMSKLICHRQATALAAIRGSLVSDDSTDLSASLLVEKIAGRAGILPSGDWPVPASWAWSTLGDLFEIYVGFTPRRSDPTLWQGDVPWVSSGEVAFGRIKATRESIARQAIGNTATKLHAPGTLLLAMIGEGKTRGQVAILDIEAAHNQNCASIRVSNTPILPEFVYIFLMARYDQTRRAAAGGNQLALNRGMIREIRIPVPPVEMQVRIVEVANEAFSANDRLSLELERAVERSARLVSSLLAEAFAGRLVPQDPNDEPAAGLLARIRAERSATIPKQRTRSRRTPKELAAPPTRVTGDDYQQETLPL